MKTIAGLIVISLFYLSCSEISVDTAGDIEQNLSVIYNPLDSFTVGVKVKKSFSDAEESSYYQSVHYDYDDLGRIEKESYYSHGDDLLIYYNQYFYNDKNKLQKIVNYHSNENEPSGFINLFITEYSYRDGLLATERKYYPSSNKTDESKYDISEGELKSKTDYHNGVLDYITVYYHENGKQVGKSYRDMRVSVGEVVDSVTYLYDGGFLVEELHQSSGILKKRILYSYDEFGRLAVEDVQIPFIYSSELEEVIKYYY